jgi:hypothetical protein
MGKKFTLLFFFWSRERVHGCPYPNLLPFSTSLYIFNSILQVRKMLVLQHPRNMRFDSCTTPIQQLHNNPSHEGGPQYVGPTLMWGIVVQLLYWCCKSNIFPYPSCVLQHIALLKEIYNAMYQLFIGTEWRQYLMTSLSSQNSVFTYVQHVLVR